MNAKPIDLALIQSWLTKRRPDTHKGECGHVVVIGGDHGMPGSVRLSAEGAARVGAGLVTVITRQSHLSTTLAGRPELIGHGIEADITLLVELMQHASVIVLGPGLGQSTWSKRVFDTVIAHQTQPLVVDADGLNWLARQTIAPRENWILTPHPGEAARLLNFSLADVQSNREQSALALQRRFGGVSVLKGHHTLIATSHDEMHTCLAGNAGMASAGMGDLLTGIIAGLLAQQLTPAQAACAGVMFHATAADRVALIQGERGMLASDLLQHLPVLVNQM